MSKEEKFGVIVSERGVLCWSMTSPYNTLDEAERAVVTWRRMTSGSPPVRSYAIGVTPWPSEDRDAQRRPELRDVEAAFAWREKRDEHTSHILNHFARVVMLCGELGRGDANYLKQLLAKK